jgi:ribosomal protein S11
MRSYLIKAVSLAVLSIAPYALSGQGASKAPSYGDSPSRWDIFAGYSYLGPHDTVTVLQPDRVTTEDVSYQAIDMGVIVSAARYFNKYVGLQAETSQHHISINTDNDDFSFYQGGLIFRFPSDEVTPFVHGLVGGALVGGPEHEPRTWGASLTAGGGLDYSTPLFNHHLAIRLFQVDYNYTHVNFGPGVYGGRANIDSVRASAGLVFHVGSILPPPPITLACSAAPSAIFPGDPVTVTGTAGAVLPKMTPSYTWTGTGVTGSGETATVATAGLAPGTYTVNGAVKEGKGDKPWESATCSATFAVKAYEPPTVSCSVTPTTIKPGDSATVTATGMSPQNRPLTYTYAASAGTVNGSGTTASYSSTGAPTGSVSITCSTADDKGQTASGTTSLTIEAPVVPATPHTQTLCSITFTKDTKRPTRVDNEAKACLDQVALSLQSQSDAKAVVVGEKASAESMPMKSKKHAKMEADFAAQRAVNTKAYLVEEKGIDASRISVATGTTDSQTVENYLVPAGATFGSDVNGTTPVDESTIKPIKRVPLGEKHHKKAKM